MTSDEIRELVRLVRSKPTIANKFDNAADKLAHEVAGLLNEREKLRELLREVLACGVEYSPPIGSYVVVQIPKELLRKMEDMKGGDA